MKWLTLPLLLVSGCESTWDKYPHSLYSALRNDTPQTTIAHQRLLERLYVSAKEKGQKPPAGIAAEYAFYSWRIGKPEKAREALVVERACYPESAKFVDLLERFLPSVAVVQVPVNSKEDVSNDF